VKAVVLGFVVLAGCATLQDERTQPVIVSSSPFGAAVFVNGKKVATTPATLVLRIDRPAEIRIVGADGKAHVCTPHTTVNHGFVAVQGILIPLWPGLVVDAWTGAWNELAARCIAP
jgi:hypothetical protein